MPERILEKFWVLCWVVGDVKRVYNSVGAIDIWQEVELKTAGESYSEDMVDATEAESSREWYEVL